MALLNTREIASIVWLCLLFGYVLFETNARKFVVGFFRDVFRAFPYPYILTLIALLILYIVGVVWALNAIGFWTHELLKETVIWFFISALALIASSIATKADTKLFETVVADNLKVIVLFQFLVDTYTFSLLVELIFVLIVTFLAMLQAVAQLDEKYKRAQTLIAILQLGIFVYVAISVTTSVIADYRSLGSMDTIRIILLGPVLSFALLPFAYLLRLYVIYEDLFVNLRIGPKKSYRLKNYARRRLILHLGLNAKNIHAFIQSGRARALNRIQSKADVDRLIEQ
jgi:hypothetical protein